jgi:hypothetical protein
LVGQGLVELYNGQPVITQAGLEALPEAERPRLTPEARKIQIDTRTSEAAAEAISKNLRIGVDQVPFDVRMPAGWTIEGDIYIPPKPLMGESLERSNPLGLVVAVKKNMEGGRVVVGKAGDIHADIPFTSEDTLGFATRDGRFLTREEAASEVAKLRAGVEAAPAPQPEARESRREPAVPKQRFYSQLQRTVEAKMPNVSSPEQLKAIIDPTRGSGVKPEEVKWSGITEAIDRIASENNGRVPKEEILKYMRDEGRVRFEEMTMGGARRQWTQADIDALEKQAQRTRNFSEYEQAVLEYEDQQLGSDANDTGNQTQYAKWQLPEGENYKEVVLTIPNDEYTSPKHFTDTKGYVAHMRLNERKDSEGGNGLFIEEIQSDRHQQAREIGYDTGAKNQKLFEAAKEFYYRIWTPFQTGQISGKDANEAFDELSNRSGFSKTEIQDEGARRKDFTNQYVEKGVPDAPFRKDWPLQMFKRALEEAVTTGKDWIGWTTGETQADRYDLSKQIDSVSTIKHVDGGRFIDVRKDGNEVYDAKYDSSGKITDSSDESTVGKNISEVIGKDLAEKILKVPDNAPPKDFRGLDLKVGGEGMAGFYDNILPKEIAKYVKKWGATVEKSEIIASSESDPKIVKSGNVWQVIINGEVVFAESRKEDAENIVAKLMRSLEGEKTAIWRVNITPEMRRIIEEEGQPVFSLREAQPTVGMTTDAVRARLEALGFGVEGMIRIVEDPQAAFEGRTIIQDGKAVRIELNASALRDNAAIDRVLNHEFAEAANADGALNKLVERLTPKEKKEINDAITRLGYEERVRTTEEAARAIETLAAGWKGRGFFERAVARVEAWGSKLGLKLTRRAAEYIAARNLSDINAGFKAAYNRFINVRGEAREGRAFVTPEENARFMELAKDPETNREELQRMVDEKLKDVMGNRPANIVGKWQAKRESLKEGSSEWYIAEYAANAFDSAHYYRTLEEAWAGLKGRAYDWAMDDDAPYSLIKKIKAAQESPPAWFKDLYWVRIDPEIRDKGGIFGHSVEAVRRDAQGNVIPLDQRFQPSTADIRYSRTEIRESRREPAPTFTEESPEAKTLSNLKASMEKVDSASETKGGKPETQKVSEIAANWMEQGGDERALQDAIIENTNLSPVNAAKVAKVIAKQYDIQQSIATAFLETQTGLSVEALPEGVTLPKEVDPDRPKPVMVRLFETYMGVKVPPTKLTVNEKTALRDQIRLKASANREAKKAQQATQSEVIDIIKAMELRGPVRPKQAAALAKRAAKVIWTSEKSMEAFVSYAEKVVINTNYDADLREAKAAQKRAQQLSKSDKVAAPQREVLADITKIGVNMLDNPAEFAVAVNHYLRGFKSVVSPDYVVIPDAEITSYISSMQTQADGNKVDFDSATNERLAIKYGIPLNELEKYLNAENIIRDLASYARREVVEGILTEKAQETLIGIKAYDQTQLRDEQRKILDEMVKVDPRNLDSEERQRFVRIGNNIIFNNQTNGAEYFVATAKGQQMAREMAKDETAIAKNKAWVNLLPSIVSPKLQRGWALELQSVADTFRNAFGKGAMGKVYRMMGMLDLNMAATKANTQLDQIQEEISAFYNGLEKKYKVSARNQDGILAEGVAGFLIQKVPEKGEAESLAQRRNLIQQDIRNRREDPERAEMANRVEALLQQLDGATVQDILNNLKQNYRPNYDSLIFLKDTLFPKYKEFLKRFDENFNDQANNYENPDYLPIGFVRAGPSLTITEEETGQFYDHVSLRPKQSSYTIKRADYTQLPTDQSTNTPKEIEFNLRRNAFDSLSDQITKAYTNPAWQRVNAFLKTPESVEVFGGRANRDFFIERLNRLRLSRMRRGALSRGYIEKTADVVSVIARKLGTGIALGGVYQTFKQAPDQLLTTLATTGRRDLLGKNAMDVLAQQLAPKTLRESTKMLNKFSIGRRGDASAGYKYINQMEGAQTRMERYFTESNWDKAKEQGSKIADIWMVALKKSDFVAAAGSWLTYYRADLAKRGIKFEGWEREAELVDTDPARQDSAAYAEQMTDIYQGSSDPTQMATFAQSGKSGWENLWKSMFVPFNSFAVQQRMRLYSDARDALTKTGADQKTGYLGLSGTIGGMVLFHMVKRLFIPVLSGAGVGVLYGIMGVDVEEPDEEKKKEDLNKRWRQMQGEILANMLVGGTGQIIEAKTIDAFNYAAYLISVQTENESVIDDNGEIMPFSTYSRERSPFWRYQSFDSAYSLGMLEIGLGQAEKAVTQSKMLMDSEEMENFTPEEQRLLYFAAVSEWLYTMRLNDADFARLVDKARRDMIKSVKDREKEIKAIRSGR